MKNYKILITGGAGYIGSMLSTKLINLIERYNLSRFDKSNFKRASSNKYEEKKYRLIIHQVEKGDTLWGISHKFTNKNHQEFIYLIKKLNNLDNSLLIEDQILIIPVNI